MSPLPQEGTGTGGALWLVRHKLEALVPPDFRRKLLGNEPCTPIGQGLCPGSTVPRDAQEPGGDCPRGGGRLGEVTHLGGLVAEPPQQQHHHVHGGSSHLGLGVRPGYGRQAGGDLWGTGAAGVGTQREVVGTSLGDEDGPPAPTQEQSHVPLPAPSSGGAPSEGLQDAQAPWGALHGAGRAEGS